MKVVQFHEHGGPEVVRYEDAPVPTPGAGEVRVKVAGSAFNPADAGIRGGTLPFPVSLPHVPGYDVSGTIDALGEGVSSLEVGDAVVGFLPMAESGSAAEYVVTRADVLVAAPTSIPLEDAAGLPSVALTAWQGLFDLGGLTDGQRVVVVGAGGAVGGYAVQLAKQAGAYVIATASPRSHGTVTAAGADEVIDHTTTSVREAITDQVDVLLNLAPIDPDAFAALVDRVRDGGIVVATTAWMPTPSDESRGVRAAGVFVEANAVQLAELVRRVDAGTLHVDIARRITFAELPELHAQAAAGQVHGKVIATPVPA